MSVDLFKAIQLLEGIQQSEYPKNVKCVWAVIKGNLQLIAQELEKDLRILQTVQKVSSHYFEYLNWLFIISCARLGKHYII